MSGLVRAWCMCVTRISNEKCEFIHFNMDLLLLTIHSGAIEVNLNHCALTWCWDLSIKEGRKLLFLITRHSAPEAEIELKSNLKLKLIMAETVEVAGPLPSLSNGVAIYWFWAENQLDLKFSGCNRLGIFSWIVPLRWMSHYSNWVKQFWVAEGLCQPKSATSSPQENRHATRFGIHFSIFNDFLCVF